MAGFAVAATPAARWKTQYFYDKDKSSLEISDLQCPSSTTCIAAAKLTESGKEKGATVSTYDGGAHWTLAEVKELPYSLFFLNESSGWMITDRSIWGTADGGRSWKKLKGIKGLERLWFLNGDRGFAVGEEKSVYETKDGGKEWSKRVLKDPFTMDPKDTVYDWIEFSTPKSPDLRSGVIAGTWDPFQPPKESEWLNPGATRRQMKALLAITKDDGQNWNQLEVSAQGKFTRLRFLNANEVLGLVEYLSDQQQPSEIFKLNLETRASKPVFLQAGRAGRDVAVLSGGEVAVAAVEFMGKSHLIPIPGKLKMMTSTSLETWVDEPVDYRAVAKRPILAVGGGQVWVATDTGMILKRQ